MVKGYCLRCRLCFLRREWGLAPLCGAAATFSGRSKDPSRPWERRCFSVRYRGAKGCLHLSVRPHCFAKHKTFGLSVMLWCESLRAYHSPSAIFCLTSALLHLPSFSKPLTTVWRQSARPLTFKSGAKIRQRHCGLKFLSNFFQNFFLRVLQCYSATVLERVFSTLRKLLYLINIEYIFDPFICILEL